jgi:Tfp pilus assembly protein PilX
MESGCIGDDGEKVNAIKANEGEMEVDGSDKADGVAAEVNAEKEAAAHKLAAEGVARAEAAKRRVEEEQRKQAANDAENKTNTQTRRMGALQVRGSLEDAVEICWMLSEEPAEWRKVLYNDKTDQQSHRTEFCGWLMTNAVSVAFWAAEKNGWVKYGRACYRIDAQGGGRRVEQATSHKQGDVWPRATAPAWAPTQDSFEWGPEGIHRTTGTPRATYAEAAGRREVRPDVAAVLEALMQKFKEEIKKDMQEFAGQAQSAKAAESPAASAAPRDGGASERALEVRVQELESKVGELMASNGQLQQLYSESYHKEKATKVENLKQKKTIEEQAERLRRMGSTFVTPDKPDKVPAWIPVSPPVRGGIPIPFGFPQTCGFSAGVGGLAPRRLRPSEEGQRFRPPETGAFPFAAFVPEPKASVAPVAPEVSAPPVQAGPESPGKLVSEAGGQTAGKEEAKRHEVRKEEEGGQPAAAAAPAAVAAPVGAAGQSSVPVGSRRPPERPPGQGGTPEAKATRSGEPAGAASPSHWKWKGPVGGSAEGRPAWKKMGNGEWQIAGRGKNSRAIKPTIC